MPEANTTDMLLFSKLCPQRNGPYSQNSRKLSRHLNFTFRIYPDKLYVCIIFIIMHLKLSDVNVT